MPHFTSGMALLANAESGGWQQNLGQSCKFNFAKFASG
jgi:hypothetical protein